MSGLILPNGVNDPRIIKSTSETVDNSNNNSVKFIKAKFTETPEKAGELATVNWDKSTVVNPMELAQKLGVPKSEDDPNHVNFRVNGVKPIDITYDPNETTFNNMQIAAIPVPPNLNTQQREAMMNQLKQNIMQMFLCGATADFAELKIPYYQCGAKYEIGDIVICSDTRNRLVDKVYTRTEMVFAILPYTSELTNLDGSTPYSADMNKAVIEGEGQVLGDDTTPVNGSETPTKAPQSTEG